MVEKPLKYQYANIETLIPYARNARVHTEAHVSQLAGSIREFGFNVPVLIDEQNNIIAGHGRVLAARKLGMEEVPVVVASHLSDTQRRAFIIADNKIHDNSTFDFETLNLEIEELKIDGFNMEVMGFVDMELPEIPSIPTGAGFNDPDLGTPPPSNYKEQYAVIVMCEDEESQRQMYDTFKAQGYSCKVVTT